MSDPVPPGVTVHRAYQVYLYTVCFVAILVLLFTAAEAVYGLVRIAAPGTTAPSFGGPVFEGGERILRPARTGVADAERDRGVAQLIQSGIFALIALIVFSFHWRRSTELRGELERRTGQRVAPAEPPSPPTEA